MQMFSFLWTLSNVDVGNVLLVMRGCKSMIMGTKKLQCDSACEQEVKQFCALLPSAAGLEPLQAATHILSTVPPNGDFDQDPVSVPLPSRVGTRHGSARAPIWACSA